MENTDMAPAFLSLASAINKFGFNIKLKERYSFDICGADDAVVANIIIPNRYGYVLKYPSHGFSKELVYRIENIEELSLYLQQYFKYRPELSNQPNLEEKKK